jgi:hypothetical protein
MKIYVLIILILAGFLAAGCISPVKPAAENVPAVTPTNTFTPFSNVTTAPPSPTISTTPNTTPPSRLKGLLKISVNGWIGEFPVFIDNVNRGAVTTQRPVSLMLEEGNHSLKVCCGAICEQQNVTIKFGEQRNIDFSEQMKKNCEFLEPTARIIGYYLNGDEMTVNVEFINPTTQTYAMSAEISCGYSYIEERSNTRVGNFVQGQVFSTLKAGERKTSVLNLKLISGYSYNYDIPTITKVSYT